MSPKELTNWRENGHGQSVELDASKLNVGYVDVSNLKEGDPYTFYLYSGFLLRGAGFHEGRILGAVAAVYKGGYQFSLAPNQNDYNTCAENGQPWFGKGSTFWRNVGPKVGLWIDGGSNGGTNFWIHFRGTATARPYPERTLTDDTYKTPGNW